MKLNALQLEAMKALVADHLGQIEDEIAADGAKVTCIVRHPSFPDSYLIVTNDELPSLRDEINRAIAKPGMGEVPAPHAPR